GILHRLVCRACLFRARVEHRLEHGLAQVEHPHVMPGLDEVARHRPAHIADTDECDGGHGFFPFVFLRRSAGRISVFSKSSPTYNNGALSALARAYEKQSPRLSFAGARNPLPKRMRASRAIRACPASSGTNSTENSASQSSNSATIPSGCIGDPPAS